MLEYSATWVYGQRKLRTTGFLIDERSQKKHEHKERQLAASYKSYISPRKGQPRVDYFQVNTFITALTIRKNNFLLQATCLYQSTWLSRHHDRGKLRTISFYADEGRNKFKRIGRIRKP